MSAQCEKAVSRLGKQCYQGYARGLIKDKVALQICMEMSETFKEAKELRAELEEEIERDALDGLSLEEARKADEHRTVTNVGKVKREAKLRLTRFAGRQTVNWHLQNHRDKVKKLSHELGSRALIMHEKEPLLEVKGHQTLCELANRLDEDANEKWEEIVAGGSVGGAKGISALSFHTLLVQFIANFANFSKGTQLGDLLLRLFKYDSAEEEQKLADHYKGTEAAAALEAQLQEVEEPDLDIGRELATMEAAYTATPEEWDMPPTETEAWVPDNSGEPETWGEDGAAKEEAGWGSESSESEKGTDWSTPPAATETWSTDSSAETSGTDWSSPPAAAQESTDWSSAPAEEAATDWSAPAAPKNDWASQPAPMASANAPRIGQAPVPSASEDDEWPDMGQAPAPAPPVAAAPAPPPAPTPPPPAAPIEISIPDPDPAKPSSLPIDLSQKEDPAPARPKPSTDAFIPQMPSDSEGLSLKPFGEDS